MDSNNRSSLYCKRSVYFYVIFNILSELVTLHSQLLIICIIVANVEAKASSSISSILC